MRAPVVDNEDRVLVAGRPDLERCDNKISTAKYSLLTFLPVVSFFAFIPLSFNRRVMSSSSRDQDK